MNEASGSLHMRTEDIYPKLVDVIIPAYNEEESIAKVIHDIPKQEVRHIVVANNASTDSTKETAEQAGAIVVDEPQAGYGSACLAGMRYIKNLATPPDAVVFIDGDYSDYPEQLTKLIDKIREGYDLVIGSRSQGDLQKGSMTPAQIFGNWLATNLIRILYKIHFTDLGPFRAVRYQSLLAMEMTDKDFGWTVEMQVKGAKMGMKCTEVPVDYRRRIGVSKISGTIKGTVLAGHKILWTIFRLI